MSEWQESQSVEEQGRGGGLEGIVFLPSSIPPERLKGGAPATLGWNIAQNASPHGRRDKIEVGAGSLRTRRQVQDSHSDRWRPEAPRAGGP